MNDDFILTSTGAIVPEDNNNNGSNGGILNTFLGLCWKVNLFFTGVVAIAIGILYVKVREEDKCILWWLTCAISVICLFAGRSGCRLSVELLCD